MNMNINNLGLSRAFVPIESAVPPPTHGVEERSVGPREGASLNVMDGVRGVEEISVPEEVLRLDDDLGQLIDKAFDPALTVIPSWQVPT